MVSCPAELCPLPAWNRTFSTADALLDHARQTGALHPLCMTCSRVFKDIAALDQVCHFCFHPRVPAAQSDFCALLQHVAAKHVVVARQSGHRRYKSQSALDQRWCALTAHTTCPICEASAPNASALAEVGTRLPHPQWNSFGTDLFTRQHIANAHPKVRCCGTLLNEVELDAHYLTSRNHPVCDKCNVGFATQVEYTEVRVCGTTSRVIFHHRSCPTASPNSTTLNYTLSCSVEFARCISHPKRR
jgi:hypothetical protein